MEQTRNFAANHIFGPLKTSFIFLRETVDEWSNLYPSRMAAALAFRGIFSLSPIMFIVATMVDVVLGGRIATAEFSATLEQILGPEIAGLVESSLISANFGPTSTDHIIAALIGLGVTLWAATSLFNEVKLSLNTIWGVPYAMSRGIFNFIRNRLMALATVFGLGLLFLLIVIVNTVVSLLTTLLRLDALLQLGAALASFALLILLIALLFKLMPDVDIKWRDVWLGSIVTALMMTIGISLIGIYLSISSVGSAYGGTTGALLATLIWLYYSAHIFVFGAKFTQSYAVRFGSHAAKQPETAPHHG